MHLLIFDNNAKNNSAKSNIAGGSLANPLNSTLWQKLKAKKDFLQVVQKTAYMHRW